MSLAKKIGNLIISKKFIINALAAIVVWVLILFGSSFYFDSYTHHGETFEVPNLLNNNADDIPVLLGDAPLNYEILDSIYNPDLVEGTVMYQRPKATDSTGVKVKRDRTIYVRVSKRTRLVKMPVVVSRSQRFAETVLKTSGLRTKVTYVPSIEDQGSVVKATYKGKEIKAGDRLPINALIELSVGKPSYGTMLAVPDLMGLTIKEAEARFDQGVMLELLSICSDCKDEKDSLEAKVIRQTPIATDSSMVPTGSTITIFLSPNAEEK